MRTGTLMVQGTTSDAGKSTLVTGICRVLARQGVRVAPFKPQNMALNSAVARDGGEIGRAQAVQAQACGTEPRSDMNPVLLKPNSDTGCQVIIQGHAVGNMEAAGFHGYKQRASHAVKESFARLDREFDAVIVEGAGSPAEINLRDNDIANMGFAESVDCPVLLIADIDRGGVFAHIVGTLSLLSSSERKRVRGSVINRFRGDLSLLQPGLNWLEKRTGKPVLGVVPYLHGLHLEAEDALPVGYGAVTRDPAALRVAVPALPHISNHTDFDPLRLHPQVDFRYVGPGETFPAADLIILPGSKNVANDLQWLSEQRWDQAILRHLRYGGKLIGICGGFQMLGRAIHDPEAIEGPQGSIEGLALFDLHTTLTQHKKLRKVNGRLALDGSPVAGYEIHAGITKGKALSNPAIVLGRYTDGAVSADNQLFGTYLHGVFESAPACNALLHWAGLEQPLTQDYAALRERQIERLADTLEEHLDMDLVCATLDLPGIFRGSRQLDRFCV